MPRGRRSWRSPSVRIISPSCRARPVGSSRRAGTCAACRASGASTVTLAPTLTVASHLIPTHPRHHPPSPPSPSPPSPSPGELSLSRALGDAEFKPKPAGSRWKGAAATQAIVAASRLSAGAGASSPNAACRSPPVAATPPAPARASALSAEPEFTVRPARPRPRPDPEPVPGPGSTPDPSPNLQPPNPRPTPTPSPRCAASRPPRITSCCSRAMGCGMCSRTPRPAA